MICGRRALLPNTGVDSRAADEQLIGLRSLRVDMRRCVCVWVAYFVLYISFMYLGVRKRGVEFTITIIMDSSLPVNSTHGP